MDKFTDTRSKEDQRQRRGFLGAEHAELSQAEPRPPLLCGTAWHPQSLFGALDNVH